MRGRRRTECKSEMEGKSETMGQFEIESEI